MFWFFKKEDDLRESQFMWVLEKQSEVNALKDENCLLYAKLVALVDLYKRYELDMSPIHDLASANSVDDVDQIKYEIERSYEC